MIYWIAALALAGIIILIVLLVQKKRNKHSELYIKGLRNENNGNYSEAIENYTDAMNEIPRIKHNRRLIDDIANRIKTLQTISAYENTFHNV